jgi:hypothetical protein
MTQHLTPSSKFHIYLFLNNLNLLPSNTPVWRGRRDAPKFVVLTNNKEEATVKSTQLAKALLSNNSTSLFEMSNLELLPFDTQKNHHAMYF